MTIERQVPAVFGHEHARHHRLGGKARFDEMLGCVLLHHLLADPAGELRTMRDDHAVLRRNYIQPIACVPSIRRWKLASLPTYRERFNDHKIHRLDDLLPWNWAVETERGKMAA